MLMPCIVLKLSSRQKRTSLLLYATRRGHKNYSSDLRRIPTAEPLLFIMLRMLHVDLPWVISDDVV